jgi:hypothetical protein
MAVKLTGVILAFIIKSSLCMAQGHCGPSLSPYIDGSAEERLIRIAELHAKGKHAIPILLPEIKNSEIAPTRLENPFVSDRPFTSPRFCGAVAAYLIEIILGITSLSMHEFPYKTSFLIQGEPENYAYALGYIIDLANGKPIHKGKLPKVSRLYGKWWETNAGKSLESMRDDWRRGKRPLTGSGYEWQ